MQSHLSKDRGKDSSSKAASENTSSHSQASLVSFQDNRSEVKQLKEMQEMANESPQAKEAAQLQSVANHPSQPAQLMGNLEEEELLQGKFSTIQRKENRTGLPDNLKSGVETLSGHSMDDVKVHYNSSKPAQLQAHAYAQGTDIHLGPGQEQHLPHEAWHVVQQKQGRVQPTKQLKSKVNINDDAGLEKEADVMGAKALQMKEESLENQTHQSKWTHDRYLQNNIAPIQGKFGKKKNKKPKRLKGGSANEVYKTDSGFFKPDALKGDQSEDIHNLVNVNLNEEDSRMSARAVASSRLDQKLGTNILAREKFDEVNGKKGSTSELVSGQEMRSLLFEGDTVSKSVAKQGSGNEYKKIGGKYKANSGSEYHEFDFMNEQIQRGMADLQAIDFLTGQIDRHEGNIFIDKETNQVKGIDNDGAFRRSEVDMNKSMTKGSAVGLPQQIHEDTAMQILFMSDEEFMEIIGGENSDSAFLNNEEKEMARNRLHTIQEHILELAEKTQEEGGLISEFNEDTYDASVNSAWGKQGYTSYLGRAVDTRNEIKAGNAPKNMRMGSEKKKKKNIFQKIFGKKKKTT